MSKSIIKIEGIYLKQLRENAQNLIKGGNVSAIFVEVGGHDAFMETKDVIMPNELGHLFGLSHGQGKED